MNIEQFLSEKISKKFTLLPGFCDVHVHFREPGFSYKETIKTGSMAAAHGGYTDVFTMPNLNPVPDNLSNLQKQLDIISKDSLINIYPYGSITKNEEGKFLSDMDTLAEKVIAFSDDGKGVQDQKILEEAMIKAKSLGKIIVAHCEDMSLVNNGYVHDGVYASLNGHAGISGQSEWKAVKEGITLSEKTNCPFHVCHVSTKESVNLIREAKAKGLDVTCESAPHYLLLDDKDLKENGSFKMNPPLRSSKDRKALISGIQDGTIDMIATDHAPHSKEEKSKGLKDSLFGISGLECAFPVLYTALVKKEIISLKKLIELLAVNPRKRFGIPIEKSFSLWDLNENYSLNANSFLSKGKSTPFDGMSVFGKCYLTVANGKIVYINENL